MQILWYVLVFAAGLGIGCLIKVRYVIKSQKYDGTIYVNQDEVTEKIVYTLELDEYPERLKFKKLVIFKVDSSE